jgi:hypothetical protein
MASSQERSLMIASRPKQGQSLACSSPTTGVMTLPVHLPLFNRINRLRDCRRGMIYPVVLFSSLIVATIGLASLQLIRLQSRGLSESNDFTEAKICARAAIDLGMGVIRQDAFWRIHHGNGTWFEDRVVGEGTCALSAEDPVDGDVRRGDNHPVILTGVGRSGDAVYRLSVRIEVGPRVGSCLETSMTSQLDIDVNSSTLTSNQTICGNDKVDCDHASTINADVEAVDSIDGSGYTKQKTLRQTAREIPAPTEALEYYLANGTTIPITSLSQWTSVQLVMNPSFETGTVGWYPRNDCQINRTSADSEDGTYSLAVTQRVSGTDSAAYDLDLNSIRSGDRYELAIPMKSTANGQAKAVMIIESSGDGIQVFESPSTTLDDNEEWFVVGGQVRPAWLGTLLRATVGIVTDNNADHLLDAVDIKNVTFDDQDYVIDRRLFSPTSNPFGATNPEGIYVIDCQDEDVQISDCRIVGTIVFLNPGGSCAITGSICWEAAVANYPALLSNGELMINLSASGLSEAALGTRFNPPGTPFPYRGGSADNDQDDAFPSSMAGLIYTGGKLTFSGTTTVDGVVISHDTIKLDSANVNLRYTPVYLDNPPPGFDGGEVTMQPVPGTWRRTTE